MINLYKLKFPALLTFTLITKSNFYFQTEKGDSNSDKRKSYNNSLKKQQQVLFHTSNQKFGICGIIGLSHAAQLPILNGHIRSTTFNEFGPTRTVELPRR